MTVDHRAGHLESLRAALSTLVYPVQYAVHLPIRAGAWVAENLSARSDLIAENERLKVDRLRLRARLEKLAELEADVESGATTAPRAAGQLLATFRARRDARG